MNRIIRRIKLWWLEREFLKCLNTASFYSRHADCKEETMQYLREAQAIALQIRVMQGAGQ